MNPFRKCLVVTLRVFKNILISNSKIRVFLYDLMNRNEFCNLYEHEKMLADSVRINKYKKAIEKYINVNDVVIDLGTGTGILAFFASKQNPKKIYAIDHSGFIKIAKKIAEHNSIDSVEFVQTNSRSFNPGVKVDVIIHEQMGDYLFNENMIQNILDLKSRLLRPGGRVIPGKFELFLEPVCLAESFATPFIYEHRPYGVDFNFLKNQQGALEEFRPADYVQEWLEAAAVKHFLCEPSPVLRFDLNELDSEEAIPRSVEVSKQVVKPGILESFCLYFKVIFDEDIFFDTSPLSENTHWGNCFFRVERRECLAGEVVDFALTMKDLLDIKTWSVAIRRFQEKGIRTH